MRESEGEKEGEKEGREEARLPVKSDIIFYSQTITLFSIKVRYEPFCKSNAVPRELRLFLNSHNFQKNQNFTSPKQCH